MKLASTALLALVASAAAIAAPSPKALPDQASEQAHENRTEHQLAIVPELPVPPPQVPEILATFTTGQQPTAQQAAAAVAVADATVTVRAKLASTLVVSVIAITATQVSSRSVPARPAGRSGDLETTRWSFADKFGRRIGDGNTLCRWATVARRLCWGEARLPRGRLVMLGSSQTRNLGEYAVIGGTGVYTFKQGVMVFRQLSLRKYALRVLLA